ncbi:MAG: FKBP-type peptidyl-prolyl cis-trans isomerase [Sediminibacterium sp.]
MNKYILIFILFFTVKIHAQKPPAKTNIPPGTASVKLNSAIDTMQYSLGAYIAQWINLNGFILNNAPLFIKGMDDVFLNKPRLVADSIVAQLIPLYQQAAQKGRSTKLEQQLFAGIKDKPGVGMFPNGVRYVILQAGKEVRPLEKDSIVINLVAKLADGTVVEDTYASKKPFHTTPLGFILIPGLNAALLEMPEGSKWTLYIPSALAYGDKSTALIPANSALVIDVELVEVKPAKK